MEDSGRESVESSMEERKKSVITSLMAGSLATLTKEALEEGMFG